MNRVTEEQFFAALKADTRDIMPSIVGTDMTEDVLCCHPYVSIWKTTDVRQDVFGKTIAHKYWLAEAIAKAEGK